MHDWNSLPPRLPRLAVVERARVCIATHRSLIRATITSVSSRGLGLEFAGRAYDIERGDPISVELLSNDGGMLAGRVAWRSRSWPTTAGIVLHLRAIHDEHTRYERWLAAVLSRRRDVGQVRD